MKPQKESYGGLLRLYLKPHWPQALLLGVLMMLGIGLQLLNPQIVRYFIDAAQSGKPLRVLMTAGGLFLGTAAVQQLVAIASTRVGQNLGWAATNELRTDMIAHCLRLDMGFHKSQRPGDLIERVDGDATTLLNFFSNMLVEVVGHLALMLGILVLMFLEDWRIGLGMAFFVCLAVFIMNRIHHIVVPRHVAVREATTDFYGFLGEALDATEDIRSCGAEGKILGRIDEKLRRWWPMQFNAAMASMSMWTSTLAIFAVGNAIAFGIGGILWSKGIITIGTVYLIFRYFEMLSGPLRQIQRQLTDLQKAGAGIRRVEELLRTEPAIRSGEGAGLPGGALPVQIDGLSFCYEDGVPVLNDISMQLLPGKVLGVLGRTGSGKSTLARLLTRFYDPSEGYIQIGGRLVQSLPLPDLRQHIAFVTQEVQLFSATVRDNLTFFDRRIPDSVILAALEEAGLEAWLKSLPDGLDTMLASDGGGMSAGEAQLLAFARVFLRNPGLVILDEASSRLDPATELRMDEALSRLFRGRTGIIIAHRLSTVGRADEILILESGRISEYGKRACLAADSQSRFSELMRQGIEEVLA